MRGVSDAQQSMVIATVAKIPVPEARKPFLIELEKRLPKAGKVSDAQLLEAINAALASFPPGRWQGDEQGVRPDRFADTLTLREAADLYQHCLKLPTWCWPPCPPRPPQRREDIDAQLRSIPLAEAAEAYERTLFNSDEEFERHKRDEAKRRQAEASADSTPWPVDPSPPPRLPVLRGEATWDEPTHVEPPAATLDDLRRAQPPAEESDDERATRLLNERLRKERLERRRRQGAPKAFF